MEDKGIKYVFSAKVYQYSSSAEMSGWTVVFFPRDMALNLRNNFKSLEEGWGRMKVTAKIGDSEWQTAIWFDTKQDTYLLPLKAAIRKKEKIEAESIVNVTIFLPVD